MKWVGWFDGNSDCEPPEPGKYWIEIQDDDGNEYCVIIHRAKNLDPSSTEVKDKEIRASIIVGALNKESK